MDSSLNKSLIINDVTTSVAPEEAEKALMNSLRLTVGILMTVAISSIMINSGINLTRKQLLKVLKRPMGPIIGFLCQFGLLPLVTLAISRAMQLPRDVQMAALINSCCPGGVMSNFLTHITDGDVALSVTMSFLSTICAFFMMPFSLWVFSSVFVGTNIQPAYLHMAISLASLIIPVTIGALLSHFRSTWASNFKKFSRIWIVATLMASGVCFAIMYPDIFSVGSDIIISGFLVALCGFFFGYSISRVLRLEEPQCRAVCFETGFQNVAISFAIIQFTFPEDPDRMFAFPLWYTTGVAVYSSLFVAGYHAHNRFIRSSNTTSPVRGFHRKINSQTVQLVTPEEVDPNPVSNGGQLKVLDKFSPQSSNTKTMNFEMTNLTPSFKNKEIVVVNDQQSLHNSDPRCSTI